MDNHIRLRTLDWEAYTKTARQAASDGIVMLRNEHETLPLPDAAKVSLFGRAQLTYYRSGTGSGGMVNVGHVTSIREALEDETSLELNQTVLHLYDRFSDEHPPKVGKGWGDDPWSQDEMPLSEEDVLRAAEESEIAIVIIGRTAGEDRDNRAEEGSYLLTGIEMDMLRKVRSAFPRMVVLLNVGNIIDMSWVEEIRPESLLYVWQGGMVGGLGVVDVLTGRVNPSGHLTDTIARSIEDYPSTKGFDDGDTIIYREDIYVGYRYFETVAKEKVLYPFGFGLSYTQFELTPSGVTTTTDEESGRIRIELDVTVKNAGLRAGRQVVQIYASQPQGELGKPARVLVDFGKTKELQPGESETLHFSMPVRRFASFDDSGKSGDVSCWVLEEGRYDLYVGDNVRDAVLVSAEEGAFTISNNWPIEQMEEVLAPVRFFERMVMVPDSEAKLHIEYEPVPMKTVDDYKRMFENMPTEIPYHVDKWKLSDVLQENCSMDDFIGQLSDLELSQIVRGEGMGSPLVTPGTAAAFGGVSEGLRDLGIPAVCCDDGPSGMRLDCGDLAFSLPNGTMLACTFDRELNRELFTFLGLEMVKNRVDCILGPGINIHRNPLNGRNFEYFSEDPYVAGEMAKAQLSGLHENGVEGVLKHFTANNRERGRHMADSVVSERALREIYLRPFAMAVREGRADAVMTSYGKVNGIHTSTLYDLTTTILREEWGFEGIVMTDWWAALSLAEVTEDIWEHLEESGDEKEFVKKAVQGEIKDFSSMVRAQNDLYMCVPDGEAADTDAIEDGRITRAELQRCAANICRFAMRTQAMKRLMGEGISVEVAGAPKDQNLDAVGEVAFSDIPEEGIEIDLSMLSGDKGEDYLFGLVTETGCHYTFEFTGSCSASELAQVPVSFFFTSIPVATMIWNGGSEELQKKRAGFTASTRNSVFRIHFGQTGVKLLSVKVMKTADGMDQTEGLLN